MATPRWPRPLLDGRRLRLYVVALAAAATIAGGVVLTIAVRPQGGEASPAPTPLPTPTPSPAPSPAPSALGAMVVPTRTEMGWQFTLPSSWRLVEPSEPSIPGQQFFL